MKMEHRHLLTYFGHANTIVNDRECFVNLVRYQSDN